MERNPRFVAEPDQAAPRLVTGEGHDSTAAREDASIHEKPAKALHSQTLVVDAHSDLPLLILKSRQRGQFNTLGQHWIPKMSQSSINVQLFAASVDATFLPEMALRRVVQQIDAMHEEIAANGSRMALCTSYADIARALQEGKIAAVLTLEGGEALGQELSALRMLHKLGIMAVQLTWSRRTFFADGSYEGCTNGGLTRLGSAAVREMNRLGILIDVAHLSDPGFWELVDLTSQPIIASHANCRSLCGHPRNLTDEEIRAVASKGGVIGVTAVSGFVSTDEPTLPKLVDHIIHIADLVGIDYVGIGTDFTLDIAEADAYPCVYDIDVMSLQGLSTDNSLPGLQRIPDLPNLTSEMLRRGFMVEDIKKVLGANFQRVFREVWS